MPRPEVIILAWPQLTERERGAFGPQLKDIFFRTSSRQNFASETERANFYGRWTEYYFSHHADLIFLALNTDKQRLLGYLMASDDSQAARSYYLTRLPSYELFADQFSGYPAHLHINCAPEFQGLGVGRRLIDELCQALVARGCPGVHLITSPTADNVGFYRHLGFTDEESRRWQNTPLLFMGKKL